MDINAQSPVKRVQIEAVIIRADGTIEDLGVISDSKWKWYNPRTWGDKKAASRRIKEANERAGG